MRIRPASRAMVCVAISSFLWGCRAVPSYPVPKQRPDELTPAEFKVHATRILNMNDFFAPQHFVRDIASGPPSIWRWTYQRPAVRINAEFDQPVKYVIDFAVAEATLRDTGPVTIAFTVNDRVLDRVRYTASGQKHFEKLVPAGWLLPGKPTIAGAEIDKVWVSKDGARLGFILVRIGFAK
jgi:hypothetical protein